jgi:hypothetical protein
MPGGPGVGFTDHIELNGATIVGTALTWTGVVHGYGSQVIDSNNDGNLDPLSDYKTSTNNPFKGNYITAGGKTYAIFQDGDTFFIPYNASEFDLKTVFPLGSTGPQTVEFDDTDFEPTGNPVCFHAGSLIQTPDGEKAVETLQIGDLVISADGRSVPVKWIGRQTVSTLFAPAERLMPVRFAAGSLGDGLPHSDLTVTADHAMLVDGVLIHAGALVNGATIMRVPLAEMGAKYTVYHIETEEHEIILANGAPSETFIDNITRRVFDNYAEFEALYGDVPEMEELDYPRAMSARQVPPAIKAKLGITKAA